MPDEVEAVAELQKWTVESLFLFLSDLITEQKANPSTPITLNVYNHIGYSHIGWRFQIDCAVTERGSVLILVAH